MDSPLLDEELERFASVSRLMQGRARTLWVRHDCRQGCVDEDK